MRKPTKRPLAQAGRVLCVDFDGTLATNAYPRIGAPRTAFIAAINAAAATGWYVIVNSCRSTLDYDDVRDWLTQQGVRYHQIALGVKPIADVYVDDRGWLPTPDALLMRLEHIALTRDGDLAPYYAALAQEQLTSPFARNITTVPETGATPDDERDSAFRVLLPFSGGMDSLTLWQMARESGVPYHLAYFDLGQAYAAQERATIATLIPDAVEVVKRRIPFAAHAHILPGRNVIILLECQRIARERGWWGEVWFGALAGESPLRGGDKSRRFLSDIQELLLPELRVVTPLIGMDKPDEVRYWDTPGRNLALLTRTKSCFAADTFQCGRCQTCFRKYVAFATVLGHKVATRLFPDGYDFSVYHDKYNAAMRSALASGDYSHYSPSRIATTLAALDALEVSAL